MNAMKIDGQTRTPPHGDALQPKRWSGVVRMDPPIDGHGRMLPLEDGARPLTGDPGAATTRAMADPEIPHNEAGVPIMPSAPFLQDPDCYLCNTASRGTWICEGHLRERAVPAEPADVQPHKLPSHIERAARAAYVVGHTDGILLGDVRRDPERGVATFRESLERDAAVASAATDDAHRAYPEDAPRITMTKSYLSGRQCCDFTIAEDDSETHEPGCPWRIVDEFARAVREGIAIGAGAGSKRSKKSWMLDRIAKLEEDMASSPIRREEGAP